MSLNVVPITEIDFNQFYSHILRADVSQQMLIEKLQHKWYTIGEYQVLRHYFKLIHMIDFEVFQVQQQDR